MFTTTEQLEEALSRPTARDCQALAGTGGRSPDSRGGRQNGTEPRRAGLRERLSEAGIETIRADLLDRDALRELPEGSNVILMAGRKFGSQGGEHWTWATNVLLPALAAERYRRIPGGARGGSGGMGGRMDSQRRRVAREADPF
jgi:hypothetical protein